MIVDQSDKATSLLATILDAAAVEFAQEGYLGTDLAAIARRSGFDAAVVGAAFTDKKQIFTTLLDEVRDELIALGAQAVAAAENPERRIHAAWNAFFEYAEAHPHRADVLTAMPFGILELKGILHASQDQATSRLAGLLVSVKGARPCDEAVERQLMLCMEFVRCGMHGLVRWWARHPETTRTALVDAMSTVAWSGLAHLQFSGGSVHPPSVEPCATDA